MLKKRFTHTAIFVFIFVFCAFFAVKLHRIDNELQQYSRTNRPFVAQNIICSDTPNPAWDIPVSSERTAFVNIVTQQPFQWVGKGFQAYAFVSQDGEYVMKFFQQQRLRDTPFLERPFATLFSSSFQNKATMKHENRDRIFTSSKLAYEELQKETGVLFVHLNKTVNQLKGIKLIDAHGQSHRVRGDDVSFLLQLKADYVIPTIVQCMKRGQKEQAKARLDQIFDLLLSLAKKGVVDSDQALVRNNNIGFVKDRALYIDTGNLVKMEGIDVYEHMKYECTKRLKPLSDWLSVAYPELHVYYEERTHAILKVLEQDGNP